ncbi:hypothetical protein CAGGBEG34_220111 [Candidatus Glomeribacter gigasporarum BEG34]|uniref:Uncharacterized protein n=1 Tax=Candidatus Glomeribacter gigasporarum BEG34 TaxID=1070319 RepID=G2J9B0_9BURK|nr:hypothetical protein CAGGBEG34_220111 [Candidatus Glomeribacter gigasporarum BEG34]
MTQHVVTPLIERNNERLQLAPVFSDKGYPPIKLPNELNGQYIGHITHSTKHFFVLNIGRSSVITDKAMWIGEKQHLNLSVGTKVKIRYNEWNAPTVEVFERNRLMRGR